MTRRLIIVGASGHGRVVADAARLAGWEDIAFLDDDEALVESGGIPVIGVSADAPRFEGADFVVAIGNAATRKRVQESLERQNLHVVTIVHPSAVIADGVVLGVGTVVMAGAVINSGVSVGHGCIINTCASIDHDCEVGDWCHVSVGSHLAGAVTLGVGCWVGIGAVVSNNIAVRESVTIGAGGVVVRDIKKPGTYVGVPVKRLERGDSSR